MPRRPDTPNTGKPHTGVSTSETPLSAEARKFAVMPYWNEYEGKYVAERLLPKLAADLDMAMDGLADAQRELDQRTENYATVLRELAEAREEVERLRRALQNVLVNVEPFLQRDTPGFYNSPSWKAIRSRAKDALDYTQPELQTPEEGER